MKLHEALTYGEKMLREYGIADPRWNAERILQFVLNVRRAVLFTDLHSELNAEQEKTYCEFLSRRALHYPLAYLEGYQEFYGRNFFVNESVLIPRPETEEIIRAVLDLQLPSNPIILDVGSGSGAIAITLSHEVPTARLIAFDLSLAALTVTKRNAQSSISIVRGDFLNAPFRNESLDVIVSNPPYVEPDDYKMLPAETRWEPREALLVSDIREIYDALLKMSMRILKQNGFVVFEIGFRQSERVESVCKSYPEFRLQDIRFDHQKIPRTFVLQKN